MSDLWLKWNSHLELLGSLDNLLETESFVDVTIAVEGRLLKAHRIVLCASSSYLNSILRSNTTPHPIIFMRDVKYLEMKAILDFIYKGEAYVSQENIQGVLKTAEALKVTGLSSISWTESSVNCVQVDRASQCDIPDHQAESEPADNLNAQKEAQEMLPILNDSSLSNSSKYHSSEERKEETEEDADIGAAVQEDGGQLTENYEEAAKVTHMSASEDGETLMILEAPPNISIASVPSLPARHKPIGRQYSNEDLQHALELIRQGRLGIKPAARAFNIPAATLHHAARRRKISSPMQQGGNHVPSHRNRIYPAS
ncbi:protein bric-a-brac 1-like [Zootermopsis nevadensis]|uniref:Protein tramtrack, alpha isoform n=1 Tax=Zootermopsis nevadensis TaxID=136037 RepID=A0A067RA74_ZOONE|nr:protein bric-a-brac 1-like [Zootermopsis nevadensis]KDR20673.1 Protein tramtrack, alpha isoform [Zootermopsis nevadensis]